MKRKVFLAFVMSAMMIFALGACSSDEAVVEENVTAVEVATLEYGTIANETTLRGNIQSDEDVYIVPKTAGVVKSISVSVGDRVSAGQVICQLDTSDMQTSLALVQSQYNTLKTAYDDAVRNLERYATLYAQGAVSLVEYEGAQSAVNQMGMEAMALQIQQVQDSINNATVTSTISGVVAEVPIQVGEMAGSSYVARVVNIDEVKLVSGVAESVVSKFSVGEEVDVYISAVSSEPFTGVVSVVPVAADYTMTYPVEVTISNPDNIIKAGMFGEVSVATEKAADVLLLPKSAIVNSNYVYVVEGDKAVLKEVVLGMSNDDYSEVIAGVVAGEEVVTVGQHLLTDGDSVNVVE